MTSNDTPPDAEKEEPLDVLDLPQLYQKPGADILLSTLADLSSKPVSWETTPRSISPQPITSSLPTAVSQEPIERKRRIKSAGIPDYLTRIISNPLSWIESDEDKEQIWETASQRLSERSGRTAMGAISRTFNIPVRPHLRGPKTATHMESVDSSGINEADTVALTLHEPALTADNLGLKTWASSYLLAKRLRNVKETLPHKPSAFTILELGAGTGLVGLAAAAVFSTHVILTDLPEIVPNLEKNILANTLSIHSFQGSAEAVVLDWSNPADFHATSREQAQPHSFLLIVAADPIYSADHPALFVNAIKQHLNRSKDARVVIELPLRSAYAAERQDLRARMATAGLVTYNEGEEVGYDDWAANSRDEEELAEVRCWWSIWGWGAAD